jgi:hypothetical protein
MPRVTATSLSFNFVLKRFHPNEKTGGKRFSAGGY